MSLAAGPLIEIIALFLPYAVAKDMEYATYVTDETGMNAINPSMVDFIRIYMSSDIEFVAGGQAYLTLSITVAIGVFALLAFLFAMLRKPIVAMVFDVLSMLAFALQNYDFSDRGVVPSDTFAWGWGMYLYVAAFILTVVCAIWTMIDRRRMRKQAAAA
ncbi:hypothetical protein ESN35_05280 [Bifidobacterium pullorum subsp. gallinarum]|uniref:Uncharacterized protein n=1 Tax=Bifidobacterium pullorum subsp. gallinarum TaxID=78344 RepID=A0A4P6DVZ0_9BIFI|nr:hypothetical protein [Bifidobacterium pullorum]QAY32890.1 hypothetical protein ESN35_05280 [Bifidobacterium pullorum subsp. gallinarum]